jgi:cysteine protease ATG4
VLNSEKNHRAWILGRQYRKKKDIEAAISNIVWLTYREHISGKLVQSDVGWGCMIRVGQMLLAETFRRHLKYNEQQNRQQLLNILSAFIDDDEGLEHVGNYSIQKIAKEAMEEYKMHVGQWHSPSSISYCLQTLHYRNPLRGT